MSQTIVLKRSALPGKVPDTGSLNLGEIAINTYDGKVFLKRSGSVESIQSLITTDSITTGSIILTQSGSFGELVVTQDANITRDLFIGRDIVSNGDIDVLGNITGSNLLVYGTITAQQMIISSSVTNMTTQYASGSTAFGDTLSDTHSFTGSVNITGSFNITGSTSFGGAVTASVFTGSFIGDGSQLTNIPGELPLNNFDFNIPDGASILDFSNESPSYIVDFQREEIVGSAIGLKGYISNASGSTAVLPTDDAVQFFIYDSYVGGFSTDSLYFINSITASAYSGSVYGIGDPQSFSASVDSRIIAATSQGQFATTGSNRFIGEQYVSGNINITGSIIPSGSASFDLGSQTNPWQHIYVSTGSIKFIGGDNKEVARINVNAESGEISLLNTSTLTSASLAQIDAGTFTGSLSVLSAISASNVYVSGAVELGYSYTSTFEIPSSNINQNTIISIPTGSYTGAFYNYIVTKGTAARAGQMMSVWNGGNLSFTETLTTDLGDTTAVTFTSTLTGGNIELVANTSNTGWKIRVIQQLI
jgi:hypothetical protein